MVSLMSSMVRRGWPLALVWDPIDDEDILRSDALSAMRL
jgi:hypothetical protein